MIRLYSSLEAALIEYSTLHTLITNLHQTITIKQNISHAKLFPLIDPKKQNLTLLPSRSDRRRPNGLNFCHLSSAIVLLFPSRMLQKDKKHPRENQPGSSLKIKQTFCANSTKNRQVLPKKGRLVADAVQQPDLTNSINFS